MPVPGALYETAKLLALAPASWLVPLDRLGSVARAIRRFGGRRRTRSSGAAEIILAHLLSDQVTRPQAFRIYQRWLDRELELTLQILALSRPGRRWHPRLRLVGRENLAAALRQGAGAILWMSDFVYAPIVLPRAIAEAGFAQTLLSRPEHGFSVAPFAIRHLNPIWVAVENRHLAERVVIENNDTRSALQILRDRLAGNRVVDIAVAETGRRTLDAPFLSGRLRMATGPLHLARTTGAPILPVHAIRRGSGSYEVSIGRPIDASDDEAAARAYTAGLEPLVRRYPDQWNGWIAIGRMTENAPGFAARFANAAVLLRDLEAGGVSLASGGPGQSEPTADALPAAAAFAACRH